MKILFCFCFYVFVLSIYHIFILAKETNVICQYDYLISLLLLHVKLDVLKLKEKKKRKKYNERRRIFQQYKLQRDACCY